MHDNPVHIWGWEVLRNLFSIPAHQYQKTLLSVRKQSGQKISDLSCICHNSGGQLLKKRQSEMWLTARLFRPGKAAQYKRLRNHPGCLIALRRFKPPDAV
ncbi:hypothetical protein T07_14808 [Trichinella nelsoni]|uniref:Uncharacterized protein n=1 Tax=Trichinella nelsoni TaxID=6336 RepID=A0A0V0SGZ9_9BILA|nr:hypothetical protein T07_14808 [Trichinella nelsoni]